MNIQLFNNKFYFRPKIDVGSYNRLTKSQYIIKGTVNYPMEFIIDAGANIGSQAIRFLNLNSKVKKIICIEADIENAKLCSKNLKNYPAKIYNNALSSITDQDLIIQKTFNSEMSEVMQRNYATLIKTNNYHKIKTLSLNDVIKRENLKRVDLIKFDINGSEDEVFSKNLEWLKITNCIAFNNADINKTTSKIIKLYGQAVGDINIYNIDQMIFLIKDAINWRPIKGFMNAKKSGFYEADERY